MSWSNDTDYFTTTQTAPRDEWTAWSGYESEHDRATRAGSVAGPIVGCVLLVAFIVALVCFTSHVRRRRQQMRNERRRNVQHGQGERSTYVVPGVHYPDWIEGGTRDVDLERVLQDLPPPYSPPYSTESKVGEPPPSYASVVYGYETHSFTEPVNNDTCTSVTYDDVMEDRDSHHDNDSMYNITDNHDEPEMTVQTENRTENSDHDGVGGEVFL